jgi:hypothetical protein
MAAQHVQDVRCAWGVHDERTEPEHKCAHTHTCAHTWQVMLQAKLIPTNLHHGVHKEETNKKKQPSVQHEEEGGKKSVAHVIMFNALLFEINEKIFWFFSSMA